MELTDIGLLDNQQHPKKEGTARTARAKTRPRKEATGSKKGPKRRPHALNTGALASTRELQRFSVFVIHFVEGRGSGSEYITWQSMV